jgi:hypothetical protein
VLTALGKKPSFISNRAHPSELAAVRSGRLQARIEKTRIFRRFVIDSCNLRGIVS